MSDRPLIFVSHASSDKPRIGHIVERLLDAGYRLFIDHPQKIAPFYTVEYCRERGIETLWTTSDRDWAAGLNDALKKCACVLVVMSEALSTGAFDAELELRRKNYRPEWNHEISAGFYAGKLAGAKIGDFDTSNLPSCARSLNAIDVSSTLDENELAVNFDILIRQHIEPIVRMSKRRAPQSDRLEPRALRLLPLCVGREPQRIEIMRSATRAIRHGAIVPVVVVGPKNELPHDFIEALPVHPEMATQGFHLIVKSINLPTSTSTAFRAEFTEMLAWAICADPDASLNDIVTELGRAGHPVIIHSRYDISARDLPSSPLGEWVAFWTELADRCDNAHIIPVVSLGMRPANPGWTDCPPCETEDAQQRARNTATLDWLADNGANVVFRRPSITAPINYDDAQAWSGALAGGLLDSRRYAALRALIDDELYAADSALEWGVNHELFRDRMVDWLETSQ